MPSYKEYSRFYPCFFPLPLLSSVSSAAPPCPSGSCRGFCSQGIFEAQNEPKSVRDMVEIQIWEWSGGGGYTNQLSCQSWEMSLFIWERLKMLHKKAAKLKNVLWCWIKSGKCEEMFLFGTAVQQTQLRCACLSWESSKFPTSLPQERTFRSLTYFTAFLWARFSIFFGLFRRLKS